MSRPADPEKAEVVSTKVSAQLKARLKAAADAEGRSLSEYLRDRLHRLYG
jgi:hypothetical protein